MNIDELNSFAAYVRQRDEEIKNEKEETNFQYEKYCFVYDFVASDQSLIPSFVKYAFTHDKSKNKKMAIKMTEYFHEELVDLTTIEESKPYFKSW